MVWEGNESSKARGGACWRACWTSVPGPTPTVRRAYRWASSWKVRVMSGAKNKGWPQDCAVSKRSLPIGRVLARQLLTNNSEDHTNCSRNKKDSVQAAGRIQWNIGLVIVLVVPVAASVDLVSIVAMVSRSSSHIWISKMVRKRSSRSTSRTPEVCVVFQSLPPSLRAAAKVSRSRLKMALGFHLIERTG